MKCSTLGGPSKCFPINGEQVNIRSFNAPTNTGELDQTGGLGEDLSNRLAQVAFKISMVSLKNIDVSDFEDQLETPVLAEDTVLQTHAQWRGSQNSGWIRQQWRHNLHQGCEPG